MLRYNKEFGRKKIRLQMADPVKKQPITLDEIEVKIYFPKEGNDHPYPPGSQPNTPNWYYYWSQTSANLAGPHLYSLKTDCTDENGDYYGYFLIKYPHQFFICEPAGRDIDTFAKTTIHEGTHMNNYNAWWSNGYEPSLDSDGDMIPNEIEVGIGLDPNNPYTISDLYNDEEYLAREAEKEWIMGKADKEDWSYLGRQY